MFGCFPFVNDKQKFDFFFPFSKGLHDESLDSGSIVCREGLIFFDRNLIDKFFIDMKMEKSKIFTN